MSKSRDIISVGYSVTVTPELWSYVIGRIQEERPDIDSTKFTISYETPVFAGVKYAKGCKGGHQASTIATQPELQIWYSKHSNTNELYFRQLYVTQQLVIVEADATPDRFFIVLCNTTGTATTLHKHNITRGHYGNPIPIERLSISATAYVHTKT